MTSTRRVRVEIFDPPTCCPTGLCGPSVDPALLDFGDGILKVNAEFDGGATIERYVLSRQPAKYAVRPEILERLRLHGVSILPITLVNGAVVKERTYPSHADLRRWIEAGAMTAADLSAAAGEVARG